jgi:hypothetical protein
MGVVRAGSKEYPDYVDAMKMDHPHLVEAIAGFQGISHVLDWMSQESLNTIDMVGQDEFEYDFMVRLEPGESWLVFGVT